MIILSTPSSGFEAQNCGATTTFVFIFSNGAFIFMQKREKSSNGAPEFDTSAKLTKSATELLNAELLDM